MLRLLCLRRMCQRRRQCLYSRQSSARTNRPSASSAALARAIASSCGITRDHHHLQQLAQLTESAFAAARARRRAQDGRRLAAKHLQRVVLPVRAARSSPARSSAGRGSCRYTPATRWRMPSCCRASSFNALAAGGMPSPPPGRRHRSAREIAQVGQRGLQLPHSGALRQFAAPVSGESNRAVHCPPGPGSSFSCISLSRYMMSRDYFGFMPEAKLSCCV